MPPPDSNRDFEALLAHAGFLRSLARALAHDAQGAEDLVQQTWVAALEHPPREGTPPRSWLATVARNLARAQGRATGRRVERERGVARAEATDGELERSIEVQQQLLRAVLELDEPYRSAIHERYYEGLPPRESASRHGVPLKTVKTRLARGLALLRTRLDREHGGNRSAWLLALVPLAGRPSWTPAAIGALAVNAKVKVTLACVAVVCMLGGAVYWSRTPAESPRTTSALAPVENLVVDAETKTDGPLASRESELPRESIAPASSGTPAAAAAVDPRNVYPWKVRGRVLDVEGLPVAGIDIVERPMFEPDRATAPPPVRATSAADGSFELDVEKSAIHLQARSPQFTTVLFARVQRHFSESAPTIVVARHQWLAGSVVDAERKPVPRARVAVELTPALRANLGVVLDHSSALAWETTADERGRFELAAAPVCPGALRASAPGHANGATAMPVHPRGDLVIRLGIGGGHETLVRGIVVDPRGKPVADATVAYLHQTVQSAADGSFEFVADLMDWDTAREPRSLRAAKVGYRHAEQEMPLLVDLQKVPELDGVRLQLGDAPLAIEGRVEDKDGEPLAGVEVAIRDGTPFGDLPLSGSLDGPKQYVTVEVMLRGGPNAAKVLTGADGRFVIAGVCDREYELAAFDAQTLRTGQRGEVRPGAEDVVIRLKTLKALERIAGRVITRTGAPVPDLKVITRRSLGDMLQMYGPVMVTDAEGRFSFLGETCPDLHFQLVGDAILVRSINPGPDARWDELEFVVGLSAHVQIDLGEQRELADNFGVRDEDGKAVMLHLMHGNVAKLEHWMPIADGKSEPVRVDAAGTTVVLYKGEKEVAQLPVALQAGKLTVVTL